MYVYIYIYTYVAALYKPNCTNSAGPEQAARPPAPASPPARPSARSPARPPALPTTQEHAKSYPTHQPL